MAHFIFEKDSSDAKRIEYLHDILKAASICISSMIVSGEVSPDNIEDLFPTDFVNLTKKCIRIDIDENNKGLSTEETDLMVNTQWPTYTPDAILVAHKANHELINTRQISTDQRLDMEGDLFALCEIFYDEVIKHLNLEENSISPDIMISTVKSSISSGDLNTHDFSEWFNKHLTYATMQSVATANHTYEYH